MAEALCEPGLVEPNMPSRFNPSMTGRGAAAVLAAGLLAACNESNTYVAPPPPKVTVAVPAQQNVTTYLEATGNAAAVNSANLVARVQGFLAAVNYQDGDHVKKDTVLFTIEPEPYRLKLEQARAAERGAEASLAQAEADYQRQLELSDRQVASKAALDRALANRDSAQAKLLQAKADTQQAAINLGYTQVKAPFDGIVTARQASVGELVGGNTPTVLATIVQSDPIYVNFSISEQDVLRIRAQLARLGVTREELKQVPVEIGLQTENGYPHKGTLDYAAPSVNRSTGTLVSRAILQNPKHVLLPGYFARVRIPLDERMALLVPDAALGTGQSGRYLMVVNAENAVEQRNVEVGQAVGELRVVEKGLKPEDRVVVGGLLKAIPGQKVDPQTAAARAAAN
jgi:RND family efflux transporter MFP subunit